MNFSMSYNIAMIIIKSPSQIEGIRKSSFLAAKTLKHLSTFVKPGVSTEALNQVCHRYIIQNGAIPATLNYQGYPKSLCTSVNDVVCHGIPSDKQILKEGDIINLDITTILDGYYGDTSATFPVGKISKESQKLIDVTRQSLSQAIKKLRKGRYLNDCVGKVIEPIAKKNNFSVVRELGGHGVGINFHEDPFIFHYDNPDQKILLKEGMTFTIEPMIVASLDPSVTLDKNDGWTVRTADSSLTAQFEHTVLITSSGCEILTLC